MKVSRIFTLDVDVVEALRGQNASALVNTLLKEHLAVKKSDPITEDEQKKKILKAKMREINMKLRVRKALQAQKCDKKMLNWVKGNLPEPSPHLFQRYCSGRGLGRSDLGAIMAIIKKNEWILEEHGTL